VEGLRLEATHGQSLHKVLASNRLCPQVRCRPFPLERRVERTGPGPLQAQISVSLPAFAVDNSDGIHSNVGSHRRPRLPPDPNENAEEVGHLLYFRDCVDDAEAKGKGRRTAGCSHLVVRQI
jgi:hypothetical protein